jgi:hypothetical protein
MRPIRINVGGVAVGKINTWGYPNGDQSLLYTIPTYHMTVSGKDDSKKPVTKIYEVMRFGVSCKDGTNATVVGLADDQTHRIKAWIPTYRVHSANSPENGGWQVYDNFLIHDGPDSASDGVFASIGCVEVMGKRGFVAFNDLIISLSGAAASTRNEKLNQIGRAGKIIIHYDKAVRPPLVRA